MLALESNKVTTVKGQKRTHVEAKPGAEGDWLGRQLLQVLVEQLNKR